MAEFYCPEIVHVECPRIVKPVIAYPCEGIEMHVDQRVQGSIGQEIKRLYRQVPGLISKGIFDIDVLFEHEGDLAIDVWNITGPEWGSGGLSTHLTFREDKGGLFVSDSSLGTSAEYNHSMLGREAEFHCFGGPVSLLSPHGAELSLEEYLARRPVLHPGTTNGRSFYIE